MMTDRPPLLPSRCARRPPARRRLPAYRGATVPDHRILHRLILKPGQNEFRRQCGSFAFSHFVFLCIPPPPPHVRRCWGGQSGPVLPKRRRHLFSINVHGRPRCQSWSLALLSVRSRREGVGPERRTLLCPTHLCAAAAGRFGGTPRTHRCSPCSHLFAACLPTTTGAAAHCAPLPGVVSLRGLAEASCFLSSSWGGRRW